MTLKLITQAQLEKIFSDAYEWLKKSTKHYPDSSDIWDLAAIMEHQVNCDGSVIPERFLSS